MSANMNLLPAALPSLSEREARFAEHFAIYDDPAAAWLASGAVAPTTKRTSVQRAAYEYLARPHVRDRIVELRNQIAANGPSATRAALVRDLEQTADVDVREIVNVSRHHCSSCYSSDAYAKAWEIATATAFDAGSTELPLSRLPIGEFDPDREPWRACASCRGAGVAVTHWTPFDQLSPAARRLLRGVELFGDGALKKVLIADGGQLREQLHRTIPGFYAPTQSVALNLHADLKPLKRGMSVEEALAIMQEISPTAVALPAPVSEQ